VAALDARDDPRADRALRDLGRRRLPLGIERRSDANARLPQGVRPALAPDSGLLFSNPTTILLLGTDHATGRGSAGRSTDQHSDSITLLRTDPGRHRLYYLSIPRDLRTYIPGHGDDKINTAFQIGGPKLRSRRSTSSSARRCRSTTS
jgi:Transcriptional regulator